MLACSKGGIPLAEPGFFVFFALSVRLQESSGQKSHPSPVSRSTGSHPLHLGKHRHLDVRAGKGDQQSHNIPFFRGEIRFHPQAAGADVYAHTAPYQGIFSLLSHGGAELKLQRFSELASPAQPFVHVHVFHAVSFLLRLMVIFSSVESKSPKGRVFSKTGRTNRLTGGQSIE
jgi:hypothetical protein